MDFEYWSNFYRQGDWDSSLQRPSSFAEFCLDKGFVSRGNAVVELGAGNGRDAIFFAAEGLFVTALDQNIEGAIKEFKKVKAGLSGRLELIMSDFVHHDFRSNIPIDVIYSRFTMHAITQVEQDTLLPVIFGALEAGGVFCVEARTVNDRLFGVGKYCDRNTYLTDHRRRFIDTREFLDAALGVGFNLAYFTEESGLSVYKEDDPVLMRIILRKPSDK